MHGVVQHTKLAHDLDVLFILVILSAWILTRLFFFF